VSLTTADDTSFNRLALKSPIPAVAYFHAPWCEVCDAGMSDLARQAASYAGRVRAVAVDAEEHRALTEQFGVWALPTYMALQHGEELARVCGFLPSGLLRLFFELALEPGAPRGIWRPTEQQLEDEVLIPMLERWGWGCARQERCAVRSGGRTSRGFVDLLVRPAGAEQPLTLFENKRAIGGEEELRRASGQAERYAIALGLPSFVVADPAALWVYALAEERASLVRRYAWHALEHDDSELRVLLLALGG
jgi:thiol-disulfide isomerase/thioredoxin